MSRRAFSVAVLILALSSIAAVPPAWTQEDGVFAPFPSRLRVAVRDPEVRLTWRDASVGVAGYRVYRHTEEITADNIREATLLETVPAGTETYLDRPEPGRYHYAVVAETEEGSLYRVLIPFRNRTTDPVSITETVEPEETGPEVRGIRASRTEDEVRLDIDAIPPDGPLVLFRSARPLDSMDALARATRVAELAAEDAPAIDFPVPGVGYYYGAFPAESLADGRPRFEPGVTVTAEPVEIPLTTARVTLPPFEGGPRSRNPLPFLRMSHPLEDASPLLPQNPVALQPKLPLDTETEAAVGRILESLPEPDVARPEPVILREDRSAAEKGAAYALSTIATGAFEAGNWEEAEMLLENLLSTSIPATVASRAHFYLAQTYYFTDRPRTAFLEFLLAQDDYYLETQPWIDRILSDLAAEAPAADTAGG
ncbi:MAG: hypothetical protein ACLFPO_02145 [Spirochaetaceae bacterium]